MTTLSTRLRSVVVATSMLSLSLVVGCSAAVSPNLETQEGAPAAALSHVHGVDVDDVRERVTLATHYGLLSIDMSATADSAAPPRVLGDYGGDVMAFVRTGDQFLLSGHPPAGSADAPNVGVIGASLDVTSWKPIALSGEVDFHAMSSIGAGQNSVVAGLDSVSGRVMTSVDGGRSWQSGSSVAARDLAVDPTGSRLFITTEIGPQLSDDRGQTWTVVDRAPLLVLIASGFDDDLQPRMVGVDVDGVLHTSHDGLEWRSLGVLPFLPDALGVGERGTIAIVSTQLAMVSRDSGETWSPISDLSLPAVSN